MKEPRIFIVEDETIVALDLQSRLESLGYNVPMTAASGEEALESAEAVRPDLMLMDINLAGRLDGIDTARQIREKFEVPIIFLTACGDDKTLDRAKEADPYGYLIKPFNDRELHSQIKMALHKNEGERELKKSEERYSLATQGADDGLWDWDLETDKIYFSPRWMEILGYSEGDLRPEPAAWFEKIHQGDRHRLKKEITAHLKGSEEHFRSEYRIQHRDGSYRWVLTRGVALRDIEGRVYRMAGSQTDITEQKLYDPQTGLPNRALFMDRLDRALEQAKASPDHSIAVVALQLSDLSRVTDSVGLGGVEQVLPQVLERINERLSSDATLVSLGEEGFALLLEDIAEAADAVRLVNKLQEGMQRPFTARDQEFYLNLAAGVSLGSDYRAAEDLVNDAQTAVHKARQSGNGLCEIFDQGMRHKAVERLKLETRLRQALDRDEFVLYYQPIVSLQDGSLIGMEALVRWINEEGRLVMPNDFIPVAEETGLIIPLERWVLSESCRQMKAWHAEGRVKGNGELPTLSVNFSPEQYRQPDVVEMLEKTLVETGFDSRNLKLEITERTFLHHRDDVQLSLAKIQDLDIQLHMDDFGTGYSSLSYLHRFPINVLKIDRSFVSNLELSSGTRQIVKTIANLGQNLRMQVTAEGIESLQQLRELQLLDCDYGQGYFFSKPLDSKHALSLVRGEHSWHGAFEDATGFADPEPTMRLLSDR